MTNTNLQPRYIADFEKSDTVIVYDRIKNKFLEIMKHREFVSMNWCENHSTLAIEAAHAGRYSQFSKAQRWKTEQELRDFYSLCSKKKIELRLLPEKALPKYRARLNLEKSGQNDLLAYHAVLKDFPRLWTTCQRPENVEIHDTSISIYEYEEYTPALAGFLYREQLKENSMYLSASDEASKYKNYIAGRLAYEPLCIEMVANRLSNHTSEDSKIFNGKTQFKLNDGRTVELNLLDILGFSKSKSKGKKNIWNHPSKTTQYVTCMMLLVDSNGDRYLNKRTGKPMGWKDIKNYGMVSSGFHQKPGFLRPKFYHNGIKNIMDGIFTKHFGTVEILDMTNPEHEALFIRIRNTCRIAYEQTTKEMIKYLEYRDGVNLFKL